MEEGTASQTARRVAAHRLDYARVPAPYGDPEADLVLARDVANGLTPQPNRMREYLRARTAFFDRVVVDAAGREIAQIVVGAAGYDGRALRYASPGVRWFEVDHPATQADKLGRIARLGIDARHVRFVAADFTKDPVGDLLTAAGLDVRKPALFLLEGIAAYLDKAVLERVLRQFREVTVKGGLLAISVSRSSSRPAGRPRLAAAVAAMGEPLRSTFTPETASRLLAAHGWQVTDGRDRLGSAGLLLSRATEFEIPYPERALPSPRRHPYSATAPVTGTLPLPALLSHALVAFTIECDNEAEHRIPHRTATGGLSPGAPASAPWLTSLAMWANCLRFVPDEGITVGSLGRLARTGTNLDGMRRWGYVTYSPDPGHGKKPGSDAVLRLTISGREARETWRGLDEIVEGRWRDRFGDGAVAASRSALAGVTGMLDPGLPDCLPILGYGLWSRCDDSDPGDPGALDPGALGVLPLWALLSKPLLAFAVEFERESDVSLAISANVLRVLTGDTTRAGDISTLAGVSKQSVAMAMGVLRKRGLATEEPDPSRARGKVVRLTERGLASQRASADLTGTIEERWRSRFGADRVEALRASLEPLAIGDPPPLFAGLDPYPDGWRARTRGQRPLPHYPMILHRGGYPDGA
jgi:methyltransferase (TIGR00027 family)